MLNLKDRTIQYSISNRVEFFGERSKILTNLKPESTVSQLLIGLNLRLFPNNTALYFKASRNDSNII